MHWLQAGPLQVAFPREASARSREANWEVVRLAYEYWRTGSYVEYGGFVLRESTLFWVVSGHARMQWSGQMHPLGPSTLILVRKGTAFRIDSIEPPHLELYALRYSGEQLEKLAERVAPQGPRLVVPAQPERVQWLFESLLNGLATHDSVYLQNGDAFLRLLLVLLCEEVRAQPALRSRMEIRFLECKALIDREFSDIHDVGGAAELCHINRDYLNRLFKRYWNMTLQEYRRRRRLNVASTLLLTTDRTLADISAHLGYGDEFTFSKAFKRYFGMAPRHWRQSGGGHRYVTEKQSSG